MSESPEERRSAVRIKYDVQFWAAECDDGKLPARGKFRQVRGSTLSPIGISFYMDAAPKTAELALMFKGQQDESYMLARVIHQQACLIDGKRHFLVGCSFVRSMSRETS